MRLMMKSDRHGRRPPPPSPPIAGVVSTCHHTGVVGPNPLFTTPAPASFLSIRAVVRRPILGAVFDGAAQGGSASCRGATRGMSADAAPDATKDATRLKMRDPRKACLFACTTGLPGRERGHVGYAPVSSNIYGFRPVKIRPLEGSSLWLQIPRLPYLVRSLYFFFPNVFLRFYGDHDASWVCEPKRAQRRGWRCVGSSVVADAGTGRAV